MLGSSEHPLRYFVDFGGRSCQVREVRGFESISEPFRFELRFDVPDADLDPESLVETEATLRLDRDRHVRSLAGILTDVSISATLRGAPKMTLVFEPRFSLSRLRQDIRIFRNKTVPQIVTEVLAHYGITPVLRLASSYDIRPYCVQMRESDYAFVNRLLEDEGIFYFFDLEGAMILGDGTAAYDALDGDPVLQFRAGFGLNQNQDAVVEIGEASVYTPGKLSLRDFNTELPRLDMDVTAAAPTGGGPEWYDYPGEYALPSEGQRKVALMADALRCQHHRQVGKSTCGRMLPGATFDLALSPSGVEDGKHLLTRVTHDYAIDGGGFGVGFEALPGGVAFRPPRVTPAPVMLNPLTGFVTGPAGEDIYTDEWGRVKVHFHWDRRLAYDDDCSHWIPVLQDNTGHSCSIPRIGWEVLVHFLEGDPDRPVVVGRVYNPKDPPHVDLPLNKTRSMIKSLTSPREPSRNDSGSNEILVEDLAGEEYLSVYAQKDQNIVVVNDKTETIQVDENDRVMRDEQIFIGKNHTAIVGGNHQPQTEGNQTWAVGGKRSVTVQGAENVTIAGNRKVNIAATHTRRIGDGDAVTARKLTEMVGAVILETSMKDNGSTATKTMTRIVGGAHVEVAKEDKNESAGKARSETIGGTLFVKAGDKIGLRSDQKRTTRIGGSLSVTSAEDMGLHAVEEFSSTAQTTQITGASDITLKVGDTALTFKDGLLAVEGDTEVKMTVAGSNNQGSGKSAQQP